MDKYTIKFKNGCVVSGLESDEMSDSADILQFKKGGTLVAQFFNSSMGYELSVEKNTGH